MRILQVTPTYLPATRYGGTIRSVHGLSAGLAGLGHHVEVFTTNVDGRSTVGAGGTAEIDGVRVRYFDCPMLRRIYWSPAMAEALPAKLAETDIVHLHSVFLWPTMAAARFAEQKGVPYVVSPRGMLVPSLIRRRGRVRKRLWIELFEKRTFSAASAVHVTSSVEARDLDRMRLGCRRLWTVPNGVDPPARPSEDAIEDFRRRRGLEGPFVLFLGRVNWKKGLERLVEAMASVPGAKLAIAGNDEDGYRRKVDEVARRWGVENRIEWLGELDGPEKDLAYASAALFVLPSYSENFGNTVLESMAAGCPTVVTPQVGAAEWVLRYEAGRVTEADPPRLARCLAELLADPPARARMGENGRRAAAEHFSWESVAARMAQGYSEVLAGRRSGR